MITGLKEVMGSRQISSERQTAFLSPSREFTERPNRQPVCGRTRRQGDPRKPFALTLTISFVKKLLLLSFHLIRLSGGC